MALACPTKATHSYRTNHQFTLVVLIYVALSPSRSEGARQINHPLCGWASQVIPKNSKRDTIKVFKPIVKRKERSMAQKAHSLSHTKWNCKYHIVFTPKYRRKIIYNQYRSSLGEIFRRLCSYKGVEIIEGHLMPDHVHMFVSIPPRISLSSFMGYLKGKSALMMFDKHANLKYKFGNRHFWAEGYYVSTVGLNEATIKKYIQEQTNNLRDYWFHDIALDKLSVKEYEDPFRDNGK